MTTANASFPVVLRQRIDGYFAEQRLSKRADGVMTVKIAGGFAASINLFKPGGQAC